MRLILVAALAACFVPSLAFAQDQEAGATAGDDQEARMRFELGQRYYDQGRFPEAATEFQAAYDASGRDALLYNVYIAHRDAGNATEAATALRSYLATDHPESERRVNLEARLETMERQAASGAETTPEGPVMESASSGGDTLVLVGAIVAGAGAATALSALGPGIVALDGESQLTERCPGGRCSSEDAGLIDDTRTLGIVTDVLWVSGAVLVAAGATLLALGVVSGDSAEDQAMLPTGGCSPDGCFGGVEGSF
ncbi:MAG: tol-pal system YbgF family protein [Sandaracinaceae bacterium]